MHAQRAGSAQACRPREPGPSGERLGRICAHVVAAQSLVDFRSAIPNISPTRVEQRLVRRCDMVGNKSAFIDAHTPGSHLKDNFCIIGRGVAENSEQLININEPHGFNVGGAGQPPGIKNSLHSHFTAEVFIVHEGTWRVYCGLEQSGEVVLRPGDVIAIPSHCFRGFENIGKEYGFLFSVLGGDDTGGVEWAPQVFIDAEDHGLVLLEEHGVWDVHKRGPPPQGARSVQPMRRSKAEGYDVYDSDQLEQRVCRSDSAAQLYTEWTPHNEYFGPLNVAAVMSRFEGVSLPADDDIEMLRLDAAGSQAGRRMRSCPTKEVLLCHTGTWLISCCGENGFGSSHIQLQAGDVFSVPAGMQCSIEAAEEGTLFTVSRSYE